MQYKFVDNIRSTLYIFIYIKRETIRSICEVRSGNPYLSRKILHDIHRPSLPGQKAARLDREIMILFIFSAKRIFEDTVHVPVYDIQGQGLGNQWHADYEV